jgi:hypothetical protein
MARPCRRAEAGGAEAAAFGACLVESAYGAGSVDQWRRALLRVALSVGPTPMEPTARSLRRGPTSVEPVASKLALVAGIEWAALMLALLAAIVFAAQAW